MNTERFVVESDGGKTKFDIDLYFEKEYIKELIKQGINSGTIRNGIDLETLHIDTVSASMKVEWDFCLEMRSWGVKNCDAVANGIGDVNFFICYYDKHSGDDEREIELINVDMSEFEIDTERTSETYSGDTKTFWNVESVAIDFEDKTITVNF